MDEIIKNVLLPLMCAIELEHDRRLYDEGTIFTEAAQNDAAYDAIIQLIAHLSIMDGDKAAAVAVHFKALTD